MATAPNITGFTQNTSNGSVVLSFTHSGSANEIFYLERAYVHRFTSEWVQVRRMPRSVNTTITDFVAPTGDVTVAYRIRATNSDGTSGAVYSANYNATLTCLDFSSIHQMEMANDPMYMRYATSRNGDRGRQTSLHRFAGRNYPVMERARQYEEKVQIEWYVETYTEFLEFYNLMADNDFWYRDNSGRSFHASTENINVNDHPVLNGFTCSATLTRIDGGINN